MERKALTHSLLRKQLLKEVGGQRLVKRLNATKYQTQEEAGLCLCLSSLLMDCGFVWRQQKSNHCPQNYSKGCSES